MKNTEAEPIAKNNIVGGSGVLTPAVHTLCAHNRVTIADIQEPQRLKTTDILTVSALDIFDKYDRELFTFFQGNVGALELGEGCSEQCGFCYLAVEKLRSLLDVDSFISEAEKNSDILKLFKPEIRIGYKSESLDNPGVIKMVKYLLEKGFSVVLITAVSKRNPDLIWDLNKLAKKYYRRKKTPYLEFHISVTEQNYKRIMSLMGLKDMSFVSFLDYLDVNGDKYFHSSIFLRYRNGGGSIGLNSGKAFSLEAMRADRLWAANWTEDRLLRRLTGEIFRAKEERLGKMFLTPLGLEMMDMELMSEANNFTGRVYRPVTNDNYLCLHNQMVVNRKQRLDEMFSSL
ncbi:MAG: hypothetical protein UR28_C0025G0003 [Candidatus Peregrinibacteria bacterium GW2011_GWF2_33_10]|nr:MAG: hypothetical protein UR28_C0025G0003 [Candidatus Peregrinibacteria bacterium GW2011_GWF2_33_10]